MPADTRSILEHLQLVSHRHRRLSVLHVHCDPCITLRPILQKQSPASLTSLNACRRGAATGGFAGCGPRRRQSGEQGSNKCEGKQEAGKERAGGLVSILLLRELRTNPCTSRSSLGWINRKGTCARASTYHEAVWQVPATAHRQGCRQALARSGPPV